MSLKKAVGFVSIAALVGTVFACSSSTTTTTPGTSTDDAGTDAKAPSSDAAPDRKDPGPSTGDGGGDQVCQPNDTAGFTPPSYKPARRQANACASAQLDSFLAACIQSSGGSATKCQAWQGDAANTACNTCLSSEKQDPAWGAFVEGPVNLAGCVELTVTDKTCGKKFSDASSCVQFACDDESNCQGATEEQQDQCLTKSLEGGCKTYNDAFEACQIPNSNPCFSGSGAARIKNILNVFCGTMPTAGDGGAQPADAAGGG